MTSFDEWWKAHGPAEFPEGGLLSALARAAWEAGRRAGLGEAEREVLAERGHWVPDYDKGLGLAAARIRSLAKETNE